jgi:hypothetical protein
MPSDAQLRFYYYGLHAVLRRYRTMSIIGWIIVLAGVASVPLSWRLGTPHGLVDTLLTAGTIVAGLVVVQQSVTALSSYLHVPFNERPGGPEDTHPAIRHIEELMRNVDEGGWQEAYAAIGTLERMQESHGLPPLSPS